MTIIKFAYSKIQGREMERRALTKKSGKFLFTIRMQTEKTRFLGTRNRDSAFISKFNNGHFDLKKTTVGATSWRFS